MTPRRAYAVSSAAWFAAALCAAPCLAADGDASHDGGRVRGVVTAIDYRKNEISLKSHARNVRIFVSPSTPVASSDGSDYHGISDIRVGSHLEVDVSAHGRSYDAQTIEIRPDK